MVRGGPRTHVELVEDDGTGSPGAPSDGPDGPRGPAPQPGDRDSSPRRRRRALTVTAALVAVAVAGAVVAESVVTSRERERIAAVAGLPGVVDVVDGPVRVVRSAADEALRRATARTPGGLLVSSFEGGDGAASVRAVDPADGTVAWETELIAPGRAVQAPPGGETVPSRGSCRGFGQTRDLLVCLADDGVSLVGRGTLTQVAPDVTRLLVLDARDGAVVTDLSDAVGDPLVSRSVAVLDDLVVLAGAGSSAVHVRAVAADGTVAWRASFPSTTTTSRGSQVELLTTTDGVAVRTPGMLRLLDATGGTVREVDLSSGAHVRGTSHDAVLVQPAPRETLVVRADGVHRLPGTWVEPTVDDRSTPGLLLTTDGTGLRAWGADGAARWARDLDAGADEVLLLAGRAVVGSGTAVVALDGATGARLWRADALWPEGGLTTDGRSVLVLAPRPPGGAPDELVALDATDGEVAWRVRLPGEVDALRPLHGVLTVYSFVPDADGAWPVISVLG